MVYNDASKPMILGFKHGDKTYLSKTMAGFMHQAGKVQLVQSDLIMPVPLHWSRLLSRRYNQAALIAKHLNHLSGLPVLPHALQRHRRTPPQGAFGFKGRIRNVQGAFTVPEKYRPRLKDKTITLIDDVYTTGATLKECATVLKRNGAQKVFVLTLARVVTPAQSENN